MQSHQTSSLVEGINLQIRHLVFLRNKILQKSAGRGTIKPALHDAPTPFPASPRHRRRRDRS